jgi:peptide chain release factor 2
MSNPDFWKDPAEAQRVQRRRKRVEEDLAVLKRQRSQEDDVRVLFEWRAAGEPVDADLRAGLDALAATVEGAESQKMLGGEHDSAPAILSINAGAGGTESQDWAEMLLRMYLRWCDRHGFKRAITEIQAGEEAGIKSVTVLVEGEFAYGYLSAEAGVHRLVRISPFDSAARRHTSFASVFAWPEIDDEIEIDVQDKDLRVDTYRSSGAGGQHVNVTDSAVRITHLPTGLYDLEKQKQQAKLDAVENAKMDIAFGSQIRSYVLHPYRMVKDHRTKYEVGDPDRVLDGDLDSFMKSTLIARAKGTLGRGAAEAADDV